MGNCGSLAGRSFRVRTRDGGRGLDLTLEIHQIAAQAIADLHAQLGELEKLLSKLLLPPEEVDGCKWRRNGNKPEHYEYEFHSLSRMYLTRKPK